MARSRGLRIGLFALAIGGLLAVLRPWTIEPIQTSTPPAFDAAAYAASAWPRVLREADEAAVDVSSVLQSAATGPGDVAAPPTRTALFVKGTGVVTDVNLQARAGQALVRVDGSGAAPATVAIQVGPVLRGTALRDALGFVRFTDFVNQSDFAAVANALNDRVVEAVLGPVDVRGLSGQRVSFTGAAARGAQAAATTLEVVPVRLAVAGQGGR
jgi:predicted lipoprotein